ncbi:MAG: SMC-Scp complex subunit ScpB [Kiritimatiellae bacterium]|nr:SMC-Scp complex subunit ScpB [Kiritimatiellia bacterium]
MSSPETLPELKEIIGAMLFAAKGAVTPKQIRRVFLQVAEDRGGMFAHFADVKEKQVAEILDEIHGILQEAHLGFSLHEVAGGLRLQNNLNCGPWVRELLEKGKPNRLSRPALETLAIIAYRQPCVKSEIEGVRGVAVDAILKRLLEMQLVKITGRSELPGRPLFFGTTQKFLEHFGLKSLEELPGISELRRVQEEKNRMADAEEELEDDSVGGAVPETDEEAPAASEEPAEPAEPAEENPTEEPDEEPVEKGPVASDGDLDESYDVDEEDEEYEDEDEDEDD